MVYVGCVPNVLVLHPSLPAKSVKVLIVLALDLDEPRGLGHPADEECAHPDTFRMFPATARGFTKARVEYNRPLALDLRTLLGHIDKVLLFAHLEPKVRDVTSTLHARGFSGALNRYDPTAYTDLLVPWLNRAAKQVVETPATGWAGKMSDRFFRGARSRAGMAAMFANVTNTLQQVTWFSIGAVKVKPKHLKAATWRYLRSPAAMAEEVAALSPFMASRQSAEVMQMRQQIDALLVNPSAYETGQAWTQRHAYFLQSAVQNVVDTLVWSGSYDQSIADGMGEAAPGQCGRWLRWLPSKRAPHRCEALGSWLPDLGSNQGPAD